MRLDWRIEQGKIEDTSLTYSCNHPRALNNAMSAISKTKVVCQPQPCGGCGACDCRQASKRDRGSITEIFAIADH